MLASLLAACTDPPHQAEWPPRRTAAAMQLAAWAAASRRAFEALPACPVPSPYSGATRVWIGTGSGALLLPPDFVKDTSGRSTYMHGGTRFDAPGRTVEVVFGHYGWTSFTSGAHGAPIPGGCRLDLRGRTFLVSRIVHADSSWTSAAAIDTVTLRGSVMLTLTSAIAGDSLGLQLVALDAESLSAR